MNTQEIDTVTIKPCKLCGVVPQVQATRSGRLHYVECGNGCADSKTEGKVSPVIAIERWNLVQDRIVEDSFYHTEFTTEEIEEELREAGIDVDAAVARVRATVEECYQRAKAKLEAEKNAN